MALWTQLAADTLDLILEDSKQSSGTLSSTSVEFGPLPSLTRGSAVDGSAKATKGGGTPAVAVKSTQEATAASPPSKKSGGELEAILNERKSVHPTAHAASSKSPPVETSGSTFLNLSEFLVEFNLTMYESQLLDHGYTSVERLCSISMDELRALGVVPAGHVRRFQEGIAALGIRHRLPAFSLNLPILAAESLSISGKKILGDTRLEVFQALYYGMRVAVCSLKRPDSLPSFYLWASEAFRSSLHPSVMTVYGVVEPCEGRSGGPMLVLEFPRRGCVYDTYLRSESSVSKGTLETRVRLLKDAATGLAYIHRCGFVHGDVRSKTMYLMRDGSVKFTMFPLRAHPRESAILNSSSLKYAAPEVLQLTPRFSFSSDVYAFGIVVWELVHLKEPFAGQSQDEISAAISSGGHPDSSCPASLGPIGGFLTTLMEACWQQSPADRPSMTEVVQSLDLMLGEFVSSNGGKEGKEAKDAKDIAKETKDESFLSNPNNPSSMAKDSSTLGRPSNSNNASSSNNHNNTNSKNNPNSNNKSSLAASAANPLAASAAVVASSNPEGNKAVASNGGNDGSFLREMSKAVRDFAMVTGSGDAVTVSKGSIVTVTRPALGLGSKLSVNYNGIVGSVEPGSLKTLAFFLKAHSAPVSRLAVTSQATRLCSLLLVTADDNGLLRLWSLDTGTHFRMVSIDQAVTFVYLEDHALWVGGAKGLLCIFDVVTGSCFKRFPFSTESAVLYAQRQEHLVYVIYENGSTALWNFRLNTVQQIGSVFSTPVTAVDSAGSVYAVGSRAGEVRLLDLASFGVAATSKRITSGSKSVRSLLFSPIDSSMAVALFAEDPEVKLLDLRRVKIASKLTGHVFNPHSLCYLRHDKEVLLVTVDRANVFVWDLTKKVVVARQELSSPSVPTCVVSFKNFVAVGCEDGKVRVWSLVLDRLVSDKGSLKSVVRLYAQDCNCSVSRLAVSFHENSVYLFVGYINGTAIVWHDPFGSSSSSSS